MAEVRQLFRGVGCAGAPLGAPVAGLVDGSVDEFPTMMWLRLVLLRPRRASAAARDYA